MRKLIGAVIELAVGDCFGVENYCNCVWERVGSLLEQRVHRLLTEDGVLATTPRRQNRLLWNGQEIDPGNAFVRLIYYPGED
ncbi:Uncharacterised protein [Mycobacteroides abscessus subsp. abscessus]|nr:Uncharacterised protein [Mycobacteroides abscessus subsp. abscessus]